MAGSNDNSALTGRIAGFVAGAATTPLPPEVHQRTRQHILCILSCMISGCDLLPGRKALDMVQDMGEAGEASLPGTAMTAPGGIAAFVNGMTARADESDDVHARSRAHPGASVVPAALAMAEREGVSGETLIRAVAAGYDIGCRVVPALGLAQIEDRGFGPQAIGQVWGASVAAAVCAGVDAREARYLLSYAAQQSGGLQSWYSDEEHVECSFFMGGMGARDGYWAADMVATGFTANPDVLSGAWTFQRAFGGDGSDLSELTAGLGERFEVMETSLKAWTIGYPIHASLNALLALRGEHGLTPDNVKAVRTIVPARDGVIVDGRNSPNINLHHVLSLALIDGTVTLASSHDAARMKHPAVLDVRGRISLVLDDEMQKLMPRRTATVEVDTTDGRTLSHRVEAVKGTPDLPMTQREVEDVAAGLIAPVLGDRRTATLVEAVRDLGAVADVRALRPLWRRG
ncbi:MAG: MmgE/PrpD family protein [Acetobacterales bacterium]